MTGVVIGALSPHPPIAVPEVGRDETNKVRSTLESLETMGKQIASMNLDAIILITPHGPVYQDTVTLRGKGTLRGDLDSFGVPSVSVSFEADEALAEEIVRLAHGYTVLLEKIGLSRLGLGAELDHGAVVPLYFLKKAGVSAKLVVVNIGLLGYMELYKVGQSIAQAARNLGKRVGVLASGDLSHRLSAEAPYGFNPKGREFDETVVTALREFQPERILLLSEDLTEAAGECGLRPICIMLGALDELSVESQVLSYQGPFGVGYCVAVFHVTGPNPHGSRMAAIDIARKERIAEIRRNESFLTRLARETVETYLRTGKKPGRPSEIPREFQRKAGVFVSIHKEGNLRGCIGTIEPAKDTIVDEVISNAVSAAFRDPRFAPVAEEELEYLDYSVDVLSEPEEVQDVSQLDPKKFGVICEKGSRRGLLLPNLPGIESPRQQVAIAKRKAGIAENESGVKLYRFTVTRYQ